MTRKLRLGLVPSQSREIAVKKQGLSEPFIARGAKFWDVLAPRASAGQEGLSAQGDEPDWVGTGWNQVIGSNARARARDGPPRRPDFLAADDSGHITGTDIAVNGRRLTA